MRHYVAFSARAAFATAPRNAYSLSSPSDTLAASDYAHLSLSVLHLVLFMSFTEAQTWPVNTQRLFLLKFVLPIFTVTVHVFIFHIVSEERGHCAELSKRR